MLVMLMGEILNYAIDMGSGAIIYVPSFIKIGLGIQRLVEGETHNTHKTHITYTTYTTYTHKHTERRSHKPNFIFSK
jgi:hypothetical protein